MAKEDAKIFINGESLRTLKTSRGYVFLVEKPRFVEEYNKCIANFEEEVKEKEAKIEQLQAELDEIVKQPIFKKILRAFNVPELFKTMNRKEKIIEDINALRLSIESLKNTIEALKYDRSLIKKSIDEFVEVLANLGISAEDVIAEYEAAKDILERKARGEYVEPVDAAPVVAEEAPVVVEEISVVEEKPVYDSVTSAIPSQNRKGAPRLSQMDKFRLRMEKTAKMQGKGSSESGENQPQ